MRGMTRKILDAIGWHQPPVPTPDIIYVVARPGEPNVRRRVWAKLRALEKSGRVKRVKVKGWRATGWVRVERPKRRCACGCGAYFVGRANRLYVTDTHRGSGHRWRQWEKRNQMNCDEPRRVTCEG